MGSCSSIVTNAENAGRYPRIAKKCTKGNITLLYPSGFVNENRIVDMEDLTMYVKLVAYRRSKSILINNGSDGEDPSGSDKRELILVNSSFKRGGTDNTINFTSDGLLTTQWTDRTHGGVKYGDNEFIETFGIKDISIDISQNFIPKVNIIFYDIRGKAVFESGSKSPYTLFFELPYPLFKLTVKGFYGKPVEYELHLLQWRSTFDDATGNFQIEAEFIGHTYAFLNDINMIYLLTMDRYMNDQDYAYFHEGQKCDICKEYWAENPNKTIKTFIEEVEAFNFQADALRSTELVKFLNESGVAYSELQETLTEGWYNRQTRTDLNNSDSILDTFYSYKDKDEGLWHLFYISRTPLPTNTKAIKSSEIFGNEIGNILNGLSDALLELRASLTRLNDDVRNIKPPSTLPPVSPILSINELINELIIEADKVSDKIEEIINNLSLNINENSLSINENEFEQFGASNNSEMYRKIQEFISNAGRTGAIIRGAGNLDYIINYISDDGLVNLINDRFITIYKKLNNRIVEIVEEELNEDIENTVGSLKARDIFNVLICNLQSFINKLINVVKEAERYHDSEISEGTLDVGKSNTGANDIRQIIEHDNQGDNGKIYAFPEYRVKKPGNCKDVFETVYPGIDFPDWPEVQFVNAIVDGIEAFRSDFNAIGQRINNTNYQPLGIYDTPIISFSKTVRNLNSIEESTNIEQGFYDNLNNSDENPISLRPHRFNYDAFDENPANFLSYNIYSRAIDSSKQNQAFSFLHIITSRIYIYLTKLVNIFEGPLPNRFFIQDWADELDEFKYDAENNFFKTLIDGELNNLTYLMTQDELYDFCDNYQDYIGGNKPDTQENFFKHVRNEITPTSLVGRNAGLVSTPLTHVELWDDQNNPSQWPFSLDNIDEINDPAYDNFFSTLSPEVNSEYQRNTSLNPQDDDTKREYVIERNYGAWLDYIDLNVEGVEFNTKVHDAFRNFTWKTFIEDNPIYNYLENYNNIYGIPYFGDGKEWYTRSNLSIISKTTAKSRGYFGANVFNVTDLRKYEYEDIYIFGFVEGGYIKNPSKTFTDNLITEVKMDTKRTGGGYSFLLGKSETGRQYFYNVDEIRTEWEDIAGWYFGDNIFVLNYCSNFREPQGYPGGISGYPALRDTSLEFPQEVFDRLIKNRVDENSDTPEQNQRFYDVGALLSYLSVFEFTYTSKLGGPNFPGFEDVDNVRDSIFTMLKTTFSIVEAPVGFWLWFAYLYYISEDIDDDDLKYWFNKTNGDNNDYPKHLKKQLIALFKKFAFSDFSFLKFDSIDNINETIKSDLLFGIVPSGLKFLYVDNSISVEDTFAKNILFTRYSDNIKLFNPYPNLWFHEGENTSINFYIRQFGLDNNHKKLKIDENKMTLLNNYCSLGFSFGQNVSLGLCDDEPKTFYVNFSQYIDDWVNDHKRGETEENKKTGSTQKKNEIKLTVYNNLKNFSDKWISEKNYSEQNGLLNCIRAKFAFTDRVLRDISQEVLLNPTQFKDLVDTPRQTVFSFINHLLVHNNFVFYPLSNFLGSIDSKTGVYSNNDFEEMFDIHVHTNRNHISGPAFLAVYTGGDSQHLDMDLYGGNLSNFNDGFDLCCGDGGFMPPDFIGQSTNWSNNQPNQNNRNTVTPIGNIYAFVVNYGAQNQGIFKSIDIDQTNFTETAESLEVIDDLIEEEGSEQSVFQGQNIYKVHEKRAYGCNVTCLGNLSIQPMTIFQLNNIPLFHGSYLILSTSHKITQGNVLTQFNGVRMPIYVKPIVTNYSTVLGFDFVTYTIDGDTTPIVVSVPEDEEPLSIASNDTPNITPENTEGFFVFI